MSSDKLDLVKRAADFARQWHGGQRRPNKSQEPKIDHIAEVAQLVTDAGGRDVEIAAAWLHDVVEDTAVTLVDVRETFGADVAVLVDGLTDPPDFAALPLAQRKALQVQRLQKKPNGVKRVKIADQTSNVKSVLEDPPLDWDARKSLTYIVGAKQLADVCAGLSPYLDACFANYYQAGLQKYEPQKDN